MNYTNDFVWGDGDLCVDANGSIYTVSEDDWSLIRYDPGRTASCASARGYLNHPSGLAIAPSTAGSGSTTGWSLYISEFDILWEKPSVPAPASTLVDASLGLDAHARRHAASALRPSARARRGAARRGARALDLARLARALRAAHGHVRAARRAERGSRGRPRRARGRPARSRSSPRAREGALFTVDGTRVRAVGRAADELPATLERPRASTSAHFRRPGAARSELYVLDGWSVRRLR